MNYTILGLGLDILGVWLLAYEFIWGYPKMWKARNAENRIQNLEENREEIKQRNWNLPSPPYTKEEIEAFHAEIDSEYENWIKEQRDIIEVNTSGHKDRAIFISLAGLLLLTGGFILQIVGAVKA